MIILIPIIEIYLFIEIGGQIGIFNTISLIFITAFVGVLYARYEGFNTLKSGMSQLVKNELPIYEIISGAALAFAAILLIIPGVYLSVVWGLSTYFLVDQNLPVIDSLRKSRELVRHIGWWKMFAVFWGLGLVLAVLGAIPLIGIVFTIGLYPVVLMISVNIYDSTTREP